MPREDVVGRHRFPTDIAPRLALPCFFLVFRLALFDSVINVVLLSAEPALVERTLCQPPVLLKVSLLSEKLVATLAFDRQLLL